MKNLVADHRAARAWSQVELARRSGIPRTTLSAIELGRIDPGVSTALAIAAALQLTVEQLFPSTTLAVDRPVWLTTAQPGARLWQAEVAGRLVYIPVQAAMESGAPHDALLAPEGIVRRTAADPTQTLVIAGCDPSLALLPSLLAPAGIRVILLQRSSTAALDLLRNRLVHIAAVHWGSAPKSNATIARKQLGKAASQGWRLLRANSWETGLALAPALRFADAFAVLAAPLLWVGREPGSGARRSAEKLFAEVGRTPPFKHLAQDHRGVAEAIRAGWAQAGVCIRLAAESAGLTFIPCDLEHVDLCFADHDAHDPRLQALLNLYQTRHFRQILGDLPGYHVQHTGSIAHV